MYSNQQVVLFGEFHWKKLRFTLWRCCRTPRNGPSFLGARLLGALLLPFDHTVWNSVGHRRPCRPARQHNRNVSLLSKPHAPGILWSDGTQVSKVGRKRKKKTSQSQGESKRDKKTAKEGARKRSNEHRMTSEDEVEVWHLPPEGTELRDRMLRVIELQVLSHHPHIRAPRRVVLEAPLALQLHFPRDLRCRTLRDLIKTTDILSQDDRRDVALQVAATMAYTHRHSVFHNHLTSDEILVTPSSSSMSSSDGMEATYQRRWWISFTHFLDASATRQSSATYKCSRNYRPPEVILGYKGDAASVDAWILGCLLMEIATGSSLFSLVSSKENGLMKPLLVKQQIEQIVHMVGPVMAADTPQEFSARHRDVIVAMSGDRNRIRASLSAMVDDADSWFDVIASCLEFNPAKRASAESLLAKPLFADRRASESHKVDGSTFDPCNSLDDLLARCSHTI